YAVFTSQSHPDSFFSCRRQCSREAVWMAVARGMGIGIVSNLEYMPHPDLRKLSFLNVDVHTYAYVVCLRERRDSRMINEFLKIVEELRET
ncbi:MAG: hypothetical protein MK434_07965, partial [SAR324 cluster bacterium]|nr:hypothetical protein [SAR324 cluster bacterium]